MSFELPEDLLSRSKSHSRRADKYGTRIDLELARSQAATREGTNLAWMETRTAFDDLLGQPRNQLITLGTAALGFGLMIMSFAGGGGGRVFSLGLFVFLVAAYPCYYIITNTLRARNINDTLFHHNLEIDRNQEATYNLIRSNFTEAEIRLAALQAGVEVEEMKIALIAAVGATRSRAAERSESAEYARDLREKQHELSLRDKDVLLEQAKSQAQVNLNQAQAEASREEIRLRDALDYQRAKAEAVKVHEAFKREMDREDRKNNQAARMQRNNIIAQYGKVLIATQQEIRNNPALKDKFTQFLDDFSFLRKSLEKSEPLSIEESQQFQILDELATRLLFNEYGLNSQDGD